ncbi:TonB-dependent receptor [Hyunsoonleella sp. SJ7]|uniref:TonB-dependent receptor n=1 Tax=Hyunsoonleella aquatilis TaxID=2762758 RepID=A0A923H9F5_9FLAO|nr:outer membrane beta-barrel family protein [Hyunsoonleella aquatilis]MBC3758898.1 TonB-dependent receptor [Hyunsoonleella aquatilis]
MLRPYLRFISIIALIFQFGVLSAQNRDIKIVGKVVEANSNQPIAYATISILSKSENQPITGGITREDGSFSISTNASDFYIEISFMGYATQTFSNFNLENQTIDLKTLVLEENQETLNEVFIRAEKSQTEFKLDKRVFNVGRDLSTTGASVFEVLNNVPSVNVNIEGEISLRGNQGVQVLIDGKPSVIAGNDGNALGTITADMIEKIEVITNPSAKYDAQGTSGIINIVIKKSDKKGLNGSATLNMGVPNSNSFGLSLNRRTEKFNFFSQMGIGLRTFPNERESINRNLTTGTSISSNGESAFDEKFNNILIGADYYINSRNVITLSGSYAFEKEDQGVTSFFTEETQADTDIWRRNETTEATNPKIRYELQYKKDFKRHKDQTLLFSALGSSFRKDQSSEFQNTTLAGDSNDLRQRSRTDYKLEEFTFKLDYTHPFLEKYTLETGAQYVINIVGNDFEVSDFENDVWVSITDFTNLFDFSQKVLGLYATTAYEGDVWGLKIGLRMEQTDIDTLLERTNEENDQDYVNLFPSAHTSYNLTDNFSLQLGYSRRINRPRLRSLNPFSSIRNNFSISTGNPKLQPEFTNSYELTGIQKLDKASLSFSVYNRYTKDVIERIIRVDEDNVSISLPENVGTNNTTGFEVNGKYSPSNWFTINGDFNINFFNRKGTFESRSFDFNGNRWSTRVTSKFKLPAEIEMEFTGDYRSRFETLLQEIAENVFMDFGLRKKLLKGRLILNLSIRDVFASRINKSITFLPNSYLVNSSQRGRFVSFGISYGFGKGEAMEFSGRR